MGWIRLGLGVGCALALLTGFLTGSAHAGSAQALAALRADASLKSTHRIPVLLHHPRRTQSFYCYPKNYWWFYRPYTTNFDGHLRCMPYFHYLGPGERPGRPGRYIK